MIKMYEPSQEAIELIKDFQRDAALMMIGEQEHISDRTIERYSALEEYDKEYICTIIAGTRKAKKMKLYLSELES